MLFSWIYVEIISAARFETILYFCLQHVCARESLHAVPLRHHNSHIIAYLHVYRFVYAIVAAAHDR